jgi:UDP-2-acetamido-3-amino-2,3-dideoxy-glucuronate N-acetyltransferase
MEEILVHERALCESPHVGKGTRIWAFAHVLPNARIGSDCNICDGVFIENDVVVGDRVTIKCGVQLWDGITIEDDVFIGPNATFTNDRFPRSKVYPEKFLQTVVRGGASIGANATILPGIEIGRGALVGAGAVATRSVPPNAIVVGNPARIVGYVDADPLQDLGTSQIMDVDRKTAEIVDTGVRGVRLFNLPQFRDVRGDLSVGEFERNIPFRPSRYFVVYGVPSRETRGEHAHRACHQFLICVAGTCNVLVDDGVTRREFNLNRPTIGIHIPPMIWGTQYNYSPDAVLLVFASESYDPDDYIRVYSEFRSLVATRDAD